MLKVVAGAENGATNSRYQRLEKAAICDAHPTVTDFLLVVLQLNGQPLRKQCVTKRDNAGSVVIPVASVHVGAVMEGNFRLAGAAVECVECSSTWAAAR